MKYRAFISYRRQDASAAARWLREKLLGFRPPGELLDRVAPAQRVELERRVAYFLDTSYQSANEDFWTGNIEPALRESEYLIVISSPSALLKRDDGSDNWVAREIDTFLEIWGEAEGRRRIILALAPGAPEDRFPGRLNALGDQWDWADLRAVSRFAWLRAGAAERLGEALLKIVARIRQVPQELLPILGREEARRRGRRRVAIGALAAIVFVVLSGALGWAIAERGNAIEQRDQARRVQGRLLARLATTTLERGDFGSALALALEALPRSGADRERPYVVEAERALREVLMAPMRETRVLRARGKARLVDLLDGGIAVLEEQQSHLVNGVPEIDAATVHVVDAQAGRSLAVLTGHRGLVSDVVVSRDGRLLLTGSDDGTARLWDIARNRQRALFAGHAANRRMNVALSHGATMVATASADDTVRLWHVGDDGSVGAPRILLACPGTMQQGPSVLFAPDDGFLAIGCVTGVRLWSIEREREIPLGRPTVATEWWVSPQLAFFGGRLYAASFDATRPRIGPLAWDVATGRFDGTVPIDTPLGGLRASQDGRQLLATFFDNSVKVWTLGAGDPLVLRHALPVVQARMLSDARRVVTLTSDGTARLWDSSGKQLASWRGFSGHANRIALSRDETAVVMAERLGDTIHVWEFANHDVRILVRPPATRPPDLSLPNPSSPALVALTVSADGSRIAAAYLDGRAFVWRASDAQLIATIDSGQSRSIMSMRFSPTDSSRLLTASEGADARLWNADNGQLITRLTTAEGYPYYGTPIFADDGAWIAGEHLHEVILWDGRSGAWKKTLQIDPARGPAAVALLSFSHDGRHLLAAGPARPVVIPGVPARPSQGSSGQIFSGPDWTASATVQYGEQWRTAALTPDGAAILVALHDQVRLLDARGGDGTRVGEHPFVNAALFAPDGRTVLSRSPGEARVWLSAPVPRFVEFATGGAAHGHEATFSPDGARLLVGSPDGKAQVWDVAGRALLAVLPLDAAVSYMRFAAGGIVTGSDDDVLRLWRYPRTTEALIDDACAMLTRPLSREQRRAFLLDEDPRDPPCGWHPDMTEKPRR